MTGDKPCPEVLILSVISLEEDRLWPFFPIFRTCFSTFQHVLSSILSFKDVSSGFREILGVCIDSSDWSLIFLSFFSVNPFPFLFILIISITDKHQPKSTSKYSRNSSQKCKSEKFRILLDDCTLLSLDNQVETIS